MDTECTQKIGAAMIINWILIVLIMAILVLSTLTKTEQPKQLEAITKESLTEMKNEDKEVIYFQKVDNIRFDFTAKKVNPYKNILDIVAEISNHNDYSVYFKTRSCYELQGDLEFDKSRFSLGFTFTCRSSYPIIHELPPQAKLIYKTQINNFSQAKTLRLGLKFYAVNRPKKIFGECFESINYSLVNNEILLSHNYRNVEDRWEFRNKNLTDTLDILWANEKQINQ